MFGKEKFYPLQPDTKLKPEETNADPGLPERVSTIKTRAVEELYVPIGNLLEELRPNLDSGAYKLIIGDDASGRIPALIFNSVIKGIYSSHGHESPSLIFIAGSRHLDEELKHIKDQSIEWVLNDQLQKLDLPEGTRILIVTEQIAKGEGLQLLTQNLSRLGVPYDIVTTHLLGKSELEKTSQTLGVTPHYGIAGALSHLYRQEVYSGVEKNPEDIFSHPADSFNYEELNQVRKDGVELAGILLDEYLGRSKG